MERALVVALLAVALPRLLPQLGALAGVATADGAVPSFTARTLDGGTLASADLRGSVVVVNVWATWCGPCRVEMPSLQRLWERRRDEGLVVVGVNTDVANGEGVRAFVEERGLDFPIVRADRALRRALGGWDGLPTTLILDREGRVRHRMVGWVAPPVLGTAVARLLAEEVSPPAP